MTGEDPFAALREQALAALAAGRFPKEIARDLGLCSVTVRRWRKRYAPAPVPPKLSLTPAQAAALVQAGRSIGSLAREFACHPQTVRRRLDQAGVTPTAPPAARDEPRLFQVLALNREGLSCREMAARLGWSEQTVARDLDAAEVPRERRRHVPPHTRKEIGRCLVAGMSLRATARRLGLGVATVWRAKEALGLGYKESGGKPG